MLATGQVYNVPTNLKDILIALSFWDDSSRRALSINTRRLPELSVAANTISEAIITP